MAGKKRFFFFKFSTVFFPFFSIVKNRKNWKNSEK